jgi:excisionase family DNA binding protein
MRTIFTTGQVAKICKVAPRTVSKWFDSGRLRGYRIPGSQDRRIPREHLIRFLKEHGMPLGELEDEALGKILLVGVELGVQHGLKDVLSVDDFKIDLAASGFEAGIRRNPPPGLRGHRLRHGTQRSFDDRGERAQRRLHGHRADRSAQR